MQTKHGAGLRHDPALIGNRRVTEATRSISNGLETFTGLNASTQSVTVKKK